MKIVTGYPPNIDEIRRTFGAKALDGACFTYGDSVYVPSGVSLPKSVEAHEAIHIRQQGDRPETWWGQYLIDPQFRLAQELEAYRAQYQYLVTNENRNYRRAALTKISKDLGGHLYGNIISAAQAKEAIRHE